MRRLVEAGATEPPTAPTRKGETMASPTAGPIPATAHSDAAGSSSTSAAAFAAHLFARLKTILKIAVVVFLVAVAGWAIWPAKYKATALVAIDPQSPRISGDKDPSYSNANEATVVSFAEVATSDSFLIPLAQKQNLIDDPEYADSSDRGPAAVAAELRRNLKVTRRGLSYLIDISFASKDADKAARIANAIAAEIVERQQSLRRGANSGISDALRSRLADLRAAVLVSEKAVADYRQENNLLDVSPDGRVGLKRLNSLTEQVGPIRARLEDARARYDKLRKAKATEDADPQIFRSDRLTELQTRLAEEKRQSAAAALTYGPRHPSLEAAQARIASIETAIKAERSRIVEQAKAEVDVLTEQNAAYEAEIAKRTREQLSTDQKEVVLQDLVRQAQADRQLYEQFLARQKTAQEQGDIGQSEAAVVSTAAPPSTTSRPPLPIMAVAGLVGGLGAGVLWVLFGERRPAGRRDEPLPPPAPVVETVETPPPVPPAPIVAAPVVAAPVVTAEAAPIRPAHPVEAPPAPVVETVAAPVAPVVSKPAPVAAVVEKAIEAPIEKAAAVVATVAAAPVVAAATAAPVEKPVEPEPVVPAVAAAPVAPAVTDVAAAQVAERRSARRASAVADEGAEAPAAVSARRHDPAQRRRRMLRVLEGHDVPLVADVRRDELASDGQGLAAFAVTLAGHLARSPGLVVSVVDTGDATLGGDLADALADAVEAEGHGVAVIEGEAAHAEPSDDDLVIEILDGEFEPRDGDHPFVLVAVEATRAGEERLDPLLALWCADVERVVVAAFVGDRA